MYLSCIRRQIILFNREPYYIISCKTRVYFQNEIESDLELLIATYENKKVEEIQDLDLIEELKKIINDEGIRKSFSFALKK